MGARGGSPKKRAGWFLVTLALGRLLSRPAGPLPHTLPGQPWNIRLLLCGAGKLGL
jgi:hypothetical protein